MSQDTKQLLEPDDLDDYWPCACVKRDRKGNLTHIKTNAPEVTKCRRCGCTKEQHDKIKASR